MTTDLGGGSGTLARDTVLRSVISALGEVVVGELPPVQESTRLFDELGLDSTMALDLLMHLEDELDVVVDAETLEMSDFETVGSLVSFALRVGGR